MHGYARLEKSGTKLQKMEGGGGVDAVPNSQNPTPKSTLVPVGKTTRFMAQILCKQAKNIVIATL